MSIIENGARTKGTFKIKRAQINPYGYWEYKLAIINSHDLYNNGVWVREKDLKAESTR